MYGLWVLIGSFVGSFYLMDLGMSQAVTRFVAKYIHEGEYLKANQIINTSLLIYSGLGVFILIIAVVVSSVFVPNMMEVSSNVELAQVILVITGLAFAIEFPSKAFPGVISAYMRYDYVAKIRLIKSLLDAFLIYVFLSNGFGLISMAVITLSTGIASTFMFVRLAKMTFKEISFTSDTVNLGTLRDIFQFSKWVFVIDLSSLFRNKMDIWFIAYFLQNSVITTYYVAVRLTEYAIQMLSQATGITGPIFTEMYARKETEKLGKSVISAIKIDFYLAIVFILGFLIFGYPLIRLWMGAEFPVGDAAICLIILSIGRFSVYISSPVQSLLLTINQHSLAAKCSILEIVMAAILSIYLIPQIGVYGAPLALTIPLFISRLVIIPYCAHQIFPFIKLEELLRMGVYLLVGLLTFYFINLHIDLKSLQIDLELFLLLIVLGLVLFFATFVLFERREIEWVLTKLKGRKVGQ